MLNIGNTNERLLIIGIDININTRLNGSTDFNYNNDNIESKISNTQDLLNEIEVYGDIESAMIKIKSVRFIETYIIVGEKVFHDFVIAFNKNLKDIYIIPKIIFFSQNSDQLILPNNIENKLFYTYFCVRTSIEDIKKIKEFIDSQRLVIETNQKYLKNSQFEQEAKVLFKRIEKESDLLLPKIYEKLIDFSQTTDNHSFIKNIYMIYKNNAKYKYLLNQMVDIPDIPIELLSKYYIRMYSLGEDLVKKMNNDLITDNNKNNILYQPFIKTLYLGLERGLFNTFLGSPLYSPQTISEEEIQDIWKYLENFKQNNLNGLEKDLRKPIIISKSFLTFNKDMNEAEKYLSFGKNALLTIINSEHEHDLYTHADIEGLSYYPNEREVLFFPFSFFGIEDFVLEPVKGIYNIKLVYLGKFNNISTNKKLININTFKDNLLKTGLLEEEKVNSLQIEDIITKNPEKCSCCCIF